MAPTTNRVVEFVHGSHEGGRIERKFCRKLCDRLRSDRRIDRWPEKRLGVGIENRICDLIRATCDEPAPDRIALGPGLFAFVVEALAIPIDDNAERQAMEPGHDAAVEFRRPSVDSDHVALAGAADRRDALVEQVSEHTPSGVGRTPDQQLICGFAPVTLEPIDIRLAASGRYHD